jgi:hypothetical protein
MQLRMIDPSTIMSRLRLHYRSTNLLGDAIDFEHLRKPKGCHKGLGRESTTIRHVDCQKQGTFTASGRLHPVRLHEQAPEGRKLCYTDFHTSNQHLH